MSFYTEIVDATNDSRHVVELASGTIRKRSLWEPRCSCGWREFPAESREEAVEQAQQHVERMG